jgi:ABC-2 type transport system ATP-binding protein
MNSEWIIKTDALNKRYKKAEDCALNSISLEIECGSFFGLLGPNGSGKTTFISILCGLLTASSGDAFVCQHNIKSMQAIKPLIGLVPQKIALYPTLTLKENLLFFASLYDLSHQAATKKINEYLSLFELHHFADKMLSTFSGGMMRRANLLAGILHEPRLLFLDEPTANVDAEARNMIFAHLRELHADGMSIVYTTHYMEEVEALCSNVAILKKGNIVANDKLANLKKSYPEKANFTDISLSWTE